MKNLKLYFSLSTLPYHILYQHNLVEDNCIVDNSNKDIVLTNIKNIFIAYRNRFNDEPYEFIEISIVIKFEDKLFRILDRVSVYDECEFEETKTCKEMNKLINELLN